MNHHHRKILHALFQHPVSANINFKDVEHVIGELGGAIEPRSGDRVAVTLNGHTAVFHNAHHSVSKDDVADLRHFLQKCGVDPALYPL